MWSSRNLGLVAQYWHLLQLYPVIITSALFVIKHFSSAYPVVFLFEGILFEWITLCFTNNSLSVAKKLHHVHFRPLNVMIPLFRVLINLLLLGFWTLFIFSSVASFITNFVVISWLCVPILCWWSNFWLVAQNWHLLHFFPFNKTMPTLILVWMSVLSCKCFPIFCLFVWSAFQFKFEWNLFLRVSKIIAFVLFLVKRWCMLLCSCF